MYYYSLVLLPSSIQRSSFKLHSTWRVFPAWNQWNIKCLFSCHVFLWRSRINWCCCYRNKRSERVLPKIIKGAVWRVIIFYILPILIICGLMPWNQVSGAESPFVQVFSSTGLPGAAHIMNFVLLTAVLSAANSGIYATSRTLFSMAQSGVAPKSLSKISNKGIPLQGIMITSICILIGVYLAYLTPSQVIGYLMTIPGFTVMLIWISICAAQLKLRPKYKNKPAFRVKWHPYTTIFGIVSLSIIFIGFLFSPNNLVGSSVSMVTIGILIILSFLFKKK